ncbi:hypothetical protein GIB67_005072 [Kingdonia uniflora]|uniref:MATH domain-containing protein n=1 Tax=Kingdonia uniflora TaxID=39325 RepID=A0A7J7KUR6_9MAGN|nr:hypothetical protein GIB67_005072 [Kingdonia uniflora]
MASTSEQHNQEFVTSVRDNPSLHHTIRIESFSALSDVFTTYKSAPFRLGSYYWKLILYPKGNNVKDHISLYLETEKFDFPKIWELEIVCKFFSYDQIRNKYLAFEARDKTFFQITGAQVRYGFSNLVHHSTFHDPCNGYLVNDICLFGVEIFIVSYRGRSKCLSLIKGVPKDKHTWMIERLTKSNDACYSNTFIAGGLKWEMKLFPSSTSRGWLNNKKVTGSTGMDFNLTLNRRGNTTGGREGLAHISWFVKNRSNHEKRHETEGIVMVGVPLPWRNFCVLDDLFPR